MPTVKSPGFTTIANEKCWDDHTIQIWMTILAHLNFVAEFDPLIEPKAVFQPSNGLVSFGYLLSHFIINVDFGVDIASTAVKFFSDHERIVVDGDNWTMIPWSS